MECAEFFNVVIKATCPNGMEDVRSYNELQMVEVAEVLFTMGINDTATVTRFEDKHNISQDKKE